MDGLKVGIIGAGNMGSAHFNCIYSGEIEGMRVTAVCDTDRRKLEEIREKSSGVALYEDYRELLDNPEVDGVIIAVPHPLHAQTAIAAFEKGRHVLVEKPVDISLSAAQRLQEAARKSGKVFGIMFNQRTNSLFRRAREMVQSGQLGELKRSIWIITNWYRTQAYYNSGGWRATWAGEGGGVLINQAPHNLDLWQWICGMPKSVTAFCNMAKYHQIEVEDEATLYTEYENGATGVFITSTGDYPGTNRLEITGTRGKIVLENGVLKFWQLSEDERRVSAESLEGFAMVPTEYMEYQAADEPGHKGILQNFTDAVLKGGELLAPGFDGIYELMISNAAYLSEWQGNRKVMLPFDPTDFDKRLAEKAETSRFHTGGPKSKDICSYLPRWKVRW